MELVTVKVAPKTREELRKIKSHPRATFDETIQNLLNKNGELHASQRTSPDVSANGRV